MFEIWPLFGWNLLMATALAAIVWLLACTRFLKNRPALEHVLWGLVLLRLITPPVFSLPVLPAIEDPQTVVEEHGSALSDMPRDLSSPADSEFSKHSSRPISDRLTSEASQPPRTPGTQVLPEANLKPSAPKLPPVENGPRFEVIRSPKIVQADEMAFSPERSSWPGLVFVSICCSLIVSVMLVVRAVSALGPFRRLFLTESPCADQNLLRLTEEAARKFGMPRPPLVFVVRGVFSPLLYPRIFGRCCLLLPLEFHKTQSDETLRHIIAHELAHIRRKDPLTNLLSFLIAVVFWWFPIAWLARHRMRMAAEASCDAMALKRMGGSRKTYALALLAVVDFTSRSPHPLPGVVSSFGNSRTLERRIEMIGNPEVHTGNSRWAWLLNVASGFALSFVPVRAQTDEQPPAKSQAETKHETRMANPKNEPPGKFALQVKPLLANGKPAHNVCLTLWRALEQDEAPPKNGVNGTKGFGLYDPVVWTDKTHDARWVRERSAHPNDGRHGWQETAFEFSDLRAGQYRITGVTYDRDANVPDPTPYGASDPVELGSGEKAREISFRLMGTAALSLRFVDGQSREPIERLAIRLRDASGMPIVHGHGSGNYFERTSGDGTVAYDFLRPGNYTVEVLGKQAGVNQFVQYDPIKRGIPIEVREAPTEIEIPVAPRALTPEEIQERFPFSVHGTVTDAKGKPLPDVEVRAATGLGTLLGGGRTVTDAQGNYRLYFGPGIHIMAGEGSPLGVGVQAALISANRKGYYETSQNQQGNLLMSDQPQTELEAQLRKDGKIWDRTSLEQIVLPDVPRKVNFTMDHAAAIVGRLHSQGQHAIADQRLSLTGEKLPPGHSVLDGVVTDREGTFRFDGVPINQAWRFKMRVPGTRIDLQSEEFTLAQAGTHFATITVKTEHAGDGSVKLTLSHDFQEEGAASNSARKASQITEDTKPAEKTPLEIEVLLAEQNLLTAQNRFKFSERMHAKGFISKSQLQADQFAADKASLELENAKAKLRTMGKNLQRDKK